MRPRLRPRRFRSSSTIGNDSVQAGLVASLNRPGGNATGVSILTAELEAKRLGLLHELVPTARHRPSGEPGLSPDQSQRQRCGGGGSRLRPANHSRGGQQRKRDRCRFCGNSAKSGPELFLLAPTRSSTAGAIRSWRWPHSHALPAIFEQREFAAAGGLMSYGTSIADAYRQMGIYAGRILKGEKPADLPVEQSAKFELVINLKTAKALGITVPSDAARHRRRGDRMTDHTAPAQAETSDAAVPRKVRSRLFSEICRAVCCRGLPGAGDQWRV